MEVFEIRHHPFMVGVQFHPEYLSRVLRPSKPYLGFVAASAGILPKVIRGKGRETSISSSVDGMNGELGDTMERVRI